MVRRYSAAVRLAAAAVLALVTACSGGSSDEPEPTSATSASPTPADPTSTPTPVAAPPPDDGVCYRLRADALTAAHNRSPTVPCKSRHTAQTYLVTTLGRSTIGDPDNPDTAAIIDHADRRCTRALKDHLGATGSRLALSQVSSAWFVPTEKDLALHARWLRCDVVAHRKGSHLAPLPRRTAGMLADSADLDRWGTCARGSAHTLTKTQARRMCELDHNWRAISATRLGAKGDGWPGRKKVRGKVLGRCEAGAREFTGNDTGEISVAWAPPTRAEWQAGERFGLCWTKTS